MARAPKLIADAGAVEAAARKLAKRQTGRPRISHWDASGVFEQLEVGADEDVALSPRLLMLLYAADLAFRLRWEIDPLLAGGQSVVVAPYVDTAIAVGRACGLSPKWLKSLFSFARKPSERHVVNGKAGSRKGDGFVEYATRYMPGPVLQPSTKLRFTRV